jgi:hypothetical protein
MVVDIMAGSITAIMGAVLLSLKSLGKSGLAMDNTPNTVSETHIPKSSAEVSKALSPSFFSALVSAVLRLNTRGMPEEEKQANM